MEIAGFVAQHSVQVDKGVGEIYSAEMNTANIELEKFGFLQFDIPGYSGSFRKVCKVNFGIQNSRDDLFINLPAEKGCKVIQIQLP